MLSPVMSLQKLELLFHSISYKGGSDKASLSLLFWGATEVMPSVEARRSAAT